ncbi:MAG: OmpH family outer membrane protein [Bacteroidetes bacterium]|nr:OmpH family outer membrane protein [Bacteroidota bacterium]MDA1119254.1 OmpH family outer membrane protein [Bacteroidota bacterium]
MKIKTLAALLVAFILTGSTFAQNLKIGYTNIDYVLSLMPEAKQIQAELDSYEKQLDNQLQAKIKEYQIKGEEYQNLPATTSEVIRKDKETEIVNLQNSIQAFQQQASNSLVEKRGELLQPAYDKIQNTIEEVATENGFTHVFSTDSGGGFVLLWAREEDNISNLILAKLGITPPSTN